MISIPGSINPIYGFEAVVCLAIGLFWMIGGYSLLSSKHQLVWTTVLCGTGIIVAVYGLGQTLGLDTRGPFYISPNSFLGHRNYAAQYLILVIPFAFFLIRNTVNYFMRTIGGTALFLCSLHLL
ncbi:hypothetical protein K8T06_01805, partial [bacterium]|nr:hypothetical protein [bacterium]